MILVTRQRVLAGRVGQSGLRGHVRLLEVTVRQRR